MLRQREGPISTMRGTDMCAAFSARSASPGDLCALVSVVRRLDSIPSENASSEM